MPEPYAAHRARAAPRDDIVSEVAGPLPLAGPRAQPLDIRAPARQRDAVAVELSVIFEGTEPGLAERRLSLSSFGEPLRLFLIALQRTASAILSSSDNPEYGGRGGQYKAEARMLDLELKGCTEEHAGAVFTCTARVPPGGQLTITQAVPEVFERYDLPALTAARLVQDIEAERSGRPRNVAVRRYLASIPPGVKSQRYIAKCGVEVLGDLQFQSFKLAEIPEDAPRLLRFAGKIASLSFETSHLFLKNPHRGVRCAATPEQLEKALALRGKEIVAGVLFGSREPSLVFLHPASEIPERPALETTSNHLLTAWGETLRRLAQ